MASVKFLHTGDWHLGMGRHFLGSEALPRFKQARIDAIRTMAKLAEDEKCSFAVVCGDVWDSNHLDRRVAGRSFEALAAMPCPVYLLPGNHDPLDAGSIYKRKELASRLPDNVHVLDSSEPVAAGPGVEIVGVPWATKRPLKDLVAEVCAELEARPGTLRICVAHGVVDQLSPDSSDPALISRAGMDAALGDGRIHYFALGDRHSVTEVGERIWYAGSPEPTAYVDVDAGKALVVELSAQQCNVTPHRTGRWRFVQETFELSSEDDVEVAEQRLSEMQDKEVTILRLKLKGSLSLKAKVHLDAIIATNEELFAALQIWERHTDLVVLPDDLDATELNLAGFARETLDELQEQARGEGAEALTARDALALLYRLVMGAPS